MRIAFLHTGEARTYRRCLNNWKKVADLYDSDFYIAAYDRVGTRLDPITDNARQFQGFILNNNWFPKKPDTTPLDEDEFIESLKILDPKIVKVVSWHEAHQQIAKRAPSSTTLWHQFFIVNELYKLIDNFDDYDLIVRTRLDTAWVGYPKFEKIDYIGYPPYTDAHPHDYLAYGPPELMKHICGLYRELPSIHRNSASFPGNQRFAGTDAHHTMAYLYATHPSAPISDNVMSMIRKDLYPTRYDVSFLLEEEHSNNWKDTTVDPNQNYNPQ